MARLDSRASIACHVTGLIRPTMPKSMKPTRPSGSTKRLPAAPQQHHSTCTQWNRVHAYRVAAPSMSHSCCIVTLLSCSNSSPTMLRPRCFPKTAVTSPIEYFEPVMDTCCCERLEFWCTWQRAKVVQEACRLGRDRARRKVTVLCESKAEMPAARGAWLPPQARAAQC